MRRKKAGMQKPMVLRILAWVKLHTIDGYVEPRGYRLPKALITGIIGVILVYIGTAGIVSVVTPWWLGRGDAPRHIDYALSIYNGNIPKFSDPLQYPKFNELANGSYRDQPAAVNPPLFYILHAPIVGPLLEAGHWEAAIAAGRAFNVILGIICILVLSWGGWIFGGRRKALFAVSVPLLAVMTHNFTSLNQNYAVDVLLIIFTSLALISSYKIIKHGPKRSYLIWLTVLSLLGMATKATYVVFLLASLLSVVISYILHSQGALRKRLIRGVLVSGLVFTITVLTIGWYYFIQNFLVSGNWTSAAPKTYGSGGRPYKSLGTVLASSNLWGMLYERIAATKPVSMIITVAAACGIAQIFDKNRFKSLVKDRTLLISAILMMITVVGIFMTQVVHAVGYGGFYFRYFLPVLLPIGLILSYGLLEIRWLRGQLVVLAALAMSLTTVEVTVKGSALKALVPGVSGTDQVEKMVEIATISNGLSNVIPTVLYICIAVGVVIVSSVLFRLSRHDS